MTVVSAVYIWMALGLAVDGRHLCNAHIWVAAFLYHLALPATSLLLSMQATCAGGAPYLAYEVYAGFLAVHAILTVYAMNDAGIGFFDAAAFSGWNPLKWTPVLYLLSLLEHLDIFTDALFVGSAAACSETIAEPCLVCKRNCKRGGLVLKRAARFVVSWRMLGPLGPLMAQLTFTGRGLGDSSVCAAWIL